MRDNMDQEMGNAPAEEPRALSDILARREPELSQMEPAGQPAPEAAAPEPPETGEQRDEQPRDEAGKFAPKQAVPPTAEKNAEAGLLAAKRAEAEKRQAAERERDDLRRELAEIRARLAAPQAPAAQQVPQQPAQPPVPLTDLMFQDPERFVQTLEQRTQEALIQTRIATSEAIARQQPDYDAAEQALAAYARSSPTAAQEVARMLRAHPAPAVWAYQAGKQIIAQQRWQPIMQQHTDPEAYIAAEVERRMAERQAAQPAPAPAPRLPTSLASARSAQPRAASTWTGPKPLDAIQGQRR